MGVSRRDTGQVVAAIALVLLDNTAPASENSPGFLLQFLA
jgi:hypothetical protein